MAALQIIAVICLTITLFGEGFGETDEEFESLDPILAEIIGQLKKEIGELKRCNEELKGGLEKEIQQNDAMEKMVKTQDHEIRRLSGIVSRNEADTRKWKPEVFKTDLLQNNTIEERVALLELQVADLDQDVNFLFDEQVIQDERLLNVEETSDQVVVELAEVNANILAMETRLSAAEENIQGLQMTDVSHDVRISALEENGGEGGGSLNSTIAFHSALTSYSTISYRSTVIFNEILLNEGDGYDSTTGVFIVPPGGDGMYYFSIYVLVETGEWGHFDMMLNDDVISSTYPDHSFSGYSDVTTGSCSAVVDVVAGDEIQGVFDEGTDTTPLYTFSPHLYNGFNGFRI